MRFLIWVTVNALALAIATWLLEGMRLTGDSTQDKIVTLKSLQPPVTTGGLESMVESRESPE